MALPDNPLFEDVQIAIRDLENTVGSLNALLESRLLGVA